MVLGACSTVSVNMPATPVIPPVFAEMPSANGDSQTPNTNLKQWWQAVPDPTLQTLIEQGLRQNADIRVALARIKEARAVVTQAESALYPTLKGFGATGHIKPEDLQGLGMNETPIAPGIAIPPIPQLVNNPPQHPYKCIWCCCSLGN